MNAVILNAGEGKRLRPLTNLKPKCLLKLNNVTILEHQLTNLIKCGIKNVVIVIGYRASQILEEMKNKDFDLEIEFIYNPIYYKTNTVYSLWLARKHIRDDFVYLNGDIVFHRSNLERLLNSRYDTSIALKRRKVGEEEVKVQLASNLVVAVGKNIDPSKADGEFVGIAKFSKRFNKLFISELNDVVKEGKADHFFEAALDRALRNFDVYAVDVSDLPCIEVDTYEDFNIAKKIYSQLAERN